MKSLSRVRLFATPWTVARQAPPSMGFSKQEYWSGLPFPPIPNKYWSIGYIVWASKYNRTWLNQLAHYHEDNYLLTFEAVSHCFPHHLPEPPFKFCCFQYLFGTTSKQSRLPHSSVGKESTCNAGDPSSILELGISTEEGIGYPLQYSGLENFMDRIVPEVAKSQRWVSDFHFHIHFIYGSACFHATFSICPTFSVPLSNVHKSVLYVCISTAALPCK